MRSSTSLDVYHSTRSKLACSRHQKKRREDDHKKSRHAVKKKTLISTRTNMSARCSSLLSSRVQRRLIQSSVRNIQTTLCSYVVHVIKVIYLIQSTYFIQGIYVSSRISSISREYMLSRVVMSYTSITIATSTGSSVYRVLYRM